MKYITNLMLIASIAVSGAALADTSANSASSSNAGALSSSGATAYTGPQSQGQGQGQGQQQGQAAYGGNQGQNQGQGQGQAAYGGNQGQGQAIVIGASGPGTLGAGAHTTGALSSSLDNLSSDSTSRLDNLSADSNLNLDLGDDNSINTYEASDPGDAVPGVFAAGTTAGGSNPCVVSIGGGGSGSGFGFNFSQAYNDGECQIREAVRLMSAIVKGDEPANQIFLREITCQSTIYWDAMERTFVETGDMRFYCDNPRPEYGKLQIRDRKNPVVHAKVRADKNISNAPGRSKHNNGFWSE